MNLSEAMLEVARLFGAVHDGTATGGTLSSLVDTRLQDPAEKYAGGTLWLLSGANAGATLDVKSHASGGTLTFEALPATAVQAGDRYAVSIPKTPKWLLMQSVNSVLTEKQISLWNDTLTVVESQEEYDLPAGVSNVKRVEVAANAEAPYGYTRSYYWEERNGLLLFDNGKLPRNAGRKIRIWYIGFHPALALSGSGAINGAVDPDWLRYSAVVYLWRHVLETVGKDEPMAADLINEAKLAAAQTSRPKLIGRDPHLGRW